MGWQERGAFEVVPLQSPQRSAAGGAGLISALLALSAQVEELDPAGGESWEGEEGEGRRERRMDRGRVQRRYGSAFTRFVLSRFRLEPVV